MSRKHWKRYIAIWMIGILLGGATVLFLYGKEMEEMMLVKKSLEFQNKKLFEENQELKNKQKESRRKQEVGIDTVRVTVLDSNLHPTIQVQVVELVEADLASLKGKKVEQVAEVHQVLHEMLRRREYVLPDRTMVEVRVKTVVISRTLHVFVTAEVKKDDVLKKVARNFLFLNPYTPT
ncbi:hypothetical protein [Brevibacillus brevis]|uniref:Sporulation membrane protein YtrI C-terminal domain-containing protein n=1 Tax=Brevibacillus brevis TaxID=1393 RepID=A0ABY9SZJ6_BREBE|nr:hypothetical protein [Brevibacillus brevis]WNC13237.1 hypothetical protein RGB73_21405 [Brevibacillus brevis]